MDFETTSFDPAAKALDPYKGHRIAGVAITADDAQGSWYVPVRHHDVNGVRHPGQVDEDAYHGWLKDHIETCANWVNANVKFDAHFAAVEGIEFKGRLTCLTNCAKIIDSDRMFKGGYGLKALSSAWLEENILEAQDAVKGYLDSIILPKRKKAQDYGLVPADIMGEYACQDVITARKLHNNMLRRLPTEMNGIWETECLLTPVLYDMEREGLCVNVQELMLKEYEIMTKLMRMEEDLHKLVGFPVTPSRPDDCYELLVNHYGLPVLEYNDDGNPSFDKFALISYLQHPDVMRDEKRVLAVKTVQAYRKLNTLLTFFVRPYQENQVGGVMHPSYNQSVRSGRMSCKRPNAQQLNKEAKALVHPKPGEAFMSHDYRQIEYRLIVHYIKDVSAILAYQQNPEIDFHQYVADMCGIPRKPAKTVNFAIGYGAGKKKVLDMLKGQMELMTRIIAQCESLPEGERARRFEGLCLKRAEEVFNGYHEMLPGLKPTTREATRCILSRGYVRNAYGRHAHLDERAAHIAFNRLIQGCAADLMKERTVALSPRYNEKTRSLGLRLAASVHDETVLVGDKAVTKDPRVTSFVAKTLEQTGVEFRVPIRTSAGWSDKSWAEASGDDGEVDIIRDETDENED